MLRIDLTGIPKAEPAIPEVGDIDLAGIPAKVTKPLISPERLPRWEDVKGQIPANLKDYEQAGKDAISVAATYDLNMSEAYGIQDTLKKELGESDLFDKAIGSFKAGVGDVYVGLGNTLKWAGMNEEFSDVYVDYGERMRVAYIPPEDVSEFTWRKTIDPEWWATSVTRAVPFTLSLIPAAIVGAYAGTAAAGAAGLGTFGTTVMGAVGGAAASRPLESAFEAAAAYEESLARGDSEEEANAAADKVFASNMMLVGMDAAQFAVAFTPLKFGKTLNPSLLRRISAGTGKLSAVALSEAGEERYQEYIQMEALGEEANFFDLDNPRLNEASTIGGIFGAGMGGAGSVWNALTRKTTEAMPEDVKQTFDVAKGNAMLDGMDEADATKVALDAVAETPEGKEHIEKVINDLKEASTKEMGAKVPEVTAPTMEQLMERLQTEDLTEEELGSLLEQFAGGREVIEEIQTEPVAAIKERLIATGMDEVEASANAALFDGFRVLAQRAGVPVEDVMARYLPEVTREGVEAPAPVVTEEDRRAITDNPFLSDQITTEEQLTDVESLRTARERINETLVEQREEQTVSDEEMKQLEEAVGFLDEKITAPAIPDTEAVAKMDVLEQSAYHGTPHKFDKFTLDHIGTGEGAQAYGWGLYFAESKDVAQWYRETIAGDIGRQMKRQPELFEKYSDIVVPIKSFIDSRKTFSEGKQAALKQWRELDARPEFNYKDKIALLEELTEKEWNVMKDKGQLLKVELAPKADEWLDWDKPLSEQSEKVKLALDEMYKKGDMYHAEDDWLASEFYELLTKQEGSDQDASLLLKQYGIPGIKYFDATSRTEQEGTSNYVVFDDELITIEEYLQAKQEGITPEEPRGRIRISPDGINIDLLKGADQSTFVHETGHLYYKMLSDLAVLPTASEDLKADYQTVRDWLGAEEDADLTVDQQEQFARGFEAYLREGKAPSSALAEAFENFKQWLMQIYKSLRDLNVHLTDEVRGVMDRMLADEGVEVAEVPEGVLPEAVAEETLEQAPREVKPRVRKITGQVKEPELLELRKEFTAAARVAREAYKAGKDYAAVKEARKIKNILARTRKLRLVRDYFNLTDADLKKISRKNPLLLSQYEFKLYIDDVRIKAAQLSETQLEKAMLINMIHEKDLGRVDNYRRVLGLPTIANMTVEQVRTFAAALEPFHDGDVFLSERELETVDRTDLAGIATWREAKERLAAEIGVSIEELEKIKVKEWDEYKWDTALAEANPFYKMLVTETTRKLLEADFRYHEIENELYDLARKSEKSRGRTLVEKAIPQDKQVMEYLETPAEERTALAEEMTPEQIDLARYMEAYFEIALKYLIQTKSLERGRENYFVHMRRTFLENVKEEGLVGAFKDLFKTYQEDEAVFNIMDEDTGNILPLEKFFQFSLRRTGGIDPTTNVTRAFLTYAQMMEKKISLDELIPKMDIYAQSITPQMYTPRGLEIDRSLKKFVNKYINNKKGRRIRWIAKQGGTIDVSIRGLRTFTTMVDLGLNIPSGIAAFTGEQVTNYTMLGAKDFAKGNARIATKKGKKIIKKYEAFIGRSSWEEFTAPGKQLTDRISDGLFGLFHEASVLANKQFLLGAITDEEYNSGEITSERLAILKLEMGRLRVVPGTKSMVGATSAGSAMMQYKTWGAPIIRTVSRDVTTLLSDLAKKPTGEALTSREAREIYRLIGITTTALIVGATALAESDDETFTGQMLKKVYRESMTLIQGVDPSLWLATPRLMGFMTQLGKNLKAIATMEEYKSKPGLVGVEGLQRQLTPRAIKQFIPKETKKEKL